MSERVPEQDTLFDDISHKPSLTLLLGKAGLWLDRGYAEKPEPLLVVDHKNGRESVYPIDIPRPEQLTIELNEGSSQET